MFTRWEKNRKILVAIPLMAFFLLAVQGAAVSAFAASDTWEVWPPKKTEEGAPATPGEAAAKEGEAAGSSVFGGFFSGTTGRTVLIASGVLILGVALLAGGGGGGGGGGTTPISH